MADYFLECQPKARVMNNRQSMTAITPHSDIQESVVITLSSAEWNLVRRLRGLGAGVHSLMIGMERRGMVDTVTVLGSYTVERIAKEQAVIIEEELKSAG